MKRREPSEALVSNAPKKQISVDLLHKVLMETISLVQSYNDRFIVPDNFMPDHPDRDKIVTYLKARSWRGTESGAAMSAGVPLSKLREWREHQEFVDWEELADEACTDLAEEVFLFQGLATGDSKILDKVLKGRRRSKYGDHQEISGPKGAPIAFEVRLGGMPRPTRIE